MGAEHNHGGYHPQENGNPGRGRTNPDIPHGRQVEQIRRRSMRRQHPSGKQPRRGK